MFALNLDTLELCYSPDDQDLAMALMEMEGYALSANRIGEVSTPYRMAHPEGFLWSRRVYKIRQAYKRYPSKETTVAA